MSDTTDEYTEKLSQAQLDAMVDLHTRFLNGRIGGRRATLKNIDLSGLNFSGKDMRQADFTGCKMTRMDLSKANFSESRLYACDLSDSNLARCNFSRADLRGARIQSANLEQANFDKADLRVGGFSKDGMYDTGESVSFRGANLSGARLVGSLANAADFSDAIMTGINMAGADLRNAEMQGADLSGAQMAGTKLKGARMKATILTGVNMAEISTMDVDLSEAITDANIGTSVKDLEQPLAKMIETHRLWVSSAGGEGRQLDLSGYDMRPLESLKGETMTAIKATGTRFFGMNLYKIQMQSGTLDKADFRRCDMEESDLRGTSFRGARFNHAHIRNSNFEPLMFGGGGANTKRFSPCDFEDASLTYADFSGCKMRMANFRGADLTNANFKGADLRECDFTGAIMDGMILDDTNTDGATLPAAKAGSAFKMKTDD